MPSHRAVLRLFACLLVAPLVLLAGFVAPAAAQTYTPASPLFWYGSEVRFSMPAHLRAGAEGTDPFASAYGLLSYNNGSPCVVGNTGCSLPVSPSLPAGAATAARQDNANASLTTIAGRAVFYTGTTTPLSSSATYTGTSRDAGADAGTAVPWGFFQAIFRADQAGTASLEGSDDQSTWYTTASASLAASTTLVLQAPVFFRYNRTKLVNGSSAQASLIVRAGYGN